MSYYTPCPCVNSKGERCSNMCTDAHHMFENYKWRRKKYGKLMDHPSNIQYICNGCHLAKRKGIKFQTEEEFCKKLGIDKRDKV